MADPHSAAHPAWRDSSGVVRRDPPPAAGEAPTPTALIVYRAQCIDCHLDFIYASEPYNGQVLQLVRAADTAPPQLRCGYCAELAELARAHNAERARAQARAVEVQKGIAAASHARRVRYVRWVAVLVGVAALAGYVVLLVLYAHV